VAWEDGRRKLSDKRWASTLGKLEIKKQEKKSIQTADFLPVLCGFPY